MENAVISANMSSATELANLTLPELGRQCFQDFVLKSFFEFLQMFYIVFPSQHKEESETEVYNYELNVSFLRDWGHLRSS